MPTAAPGAGTETRAARGLARALVERAPHDEPHDDLGALVAAPPREVRDAHPRQALRVPVDQVEELAVPRLVVEPGALADHLVRQAAGADHRDPEVLGIGPDRLPDGLAELVASRRLGQRVLQDVHHQRHDAPRPVGLRRPHHRERRVEAVIERQVLDDVIEHDLQALTRLVPRLAVMDRGRIIAEGDPKAVLDDATVREAYLGGVS